MNNFIQVQNAEMVFNTKKGRFHALREINLDGGQGRVRHADRPLGLRQVDAAEPDRRPAAAHQRRAAVRQPRDRRARARSARVVFQNHSLLPWLTCFENVHLAVERVFGATEITRRS